MNRRQAIGTIALGTAAITLFPQCQTATLPTFENFVVESKPYQLLTHLSQIILPLGETEVLTPEPTPEYILNVIDVCSTSEERTNFLSGWKEYETYLKENVGRSYKKWDSEETANVLEYLEQLDAKESPLGYFYQETKSLTTHHFRTSELYMTNYLEYKFLPGAYEGCVAV